MGVRRPTVSPSHPPSCDHEGSPHRRQFRIAAFPSSVVDPTLINPALLSDFPRTADGRVYHLGLRAGEVANRIVGPPSHPCSPRSTARFAPTPRRVRADHRRRAVPRRGPRRALRRRAARVPARLRARLHDAHRPLPRRARVRREHRDGPPERGLLRARGARVRARGHGRREVRRRVPSPPVPPRARAGADDDDDARRLGSCGCLLDVPVGTVVVPRASVAVSRNYDFDFIAGVGDGPPYRISKPVRAAPCSDRSPLFMPLLS